MGVGVIVRRNERVNWDLQWERRGIGRICGISKRFGSLRNRVWVGVVEDWKECRGTDDETVMVVVRECVCACVFLVSAYVCVYVVIT